MTQIIEGLPFGRYCEIDAINNSGLKLIRQSPMHYKFSERKETKALVIGHASHTATLEPHLFDENYCVFGEGMTKTTKEGKAEWNKLEATGKTILRHSDAVDAKRIAQACLENQTSGRLLLGGKPELTIISELRGVIAKARFDYLYNSSDDFEWFQSIFSFSGAEPGNYIIDLKSTENASPEKFLKSIVSYGYDVQAAFYTDIGNAAGLDIKGFIFIAVESSSPYAVGIYELDQDSIEIGRQKYQEALETYIECEFSDRWPGYSPEIITLSLPAWARN